MQFSEATLLTGDVLDRLAVIDRKSVDLCYMDPPFAIQMDSDNGWDSYMKHPRHALFPGCSDRLARFLSWFEALLVSVKATLTDVATLWIHLDPTAAPYVRVLCDAIFGHQSFRNEIVWTYAGAKPGKRDFPRKHDTLLRYCVSTKEWTFNADDVRVPFKDEYLKSFNKVDDDGRRYFELKSPDRTRRYYADVGEIPWDYWTDIPAGQQMKKSERVGYPTQKPLALLERVVRSTSNPGDLVLDPFCGSGTTAVASLQHGRRFVGVDAAQDSVDATLTRVKSLLGIDVKLA